MKKMLVTGGAGFIGSNFVRHTLESFPDMYIFNLDKLTYAGNPLNFSGFSEDLNKRYKFVHGDICDSPAVNKLIDQEDFDSIVHFAAESHVDRSILGPSAFIETNINGTFNLLEAGLKYCGNVGCC